MNIRRGTIEDIASLISIRMEFLRIVKNYEVTFPESFQDDNYEFMKKHISEDTLGIWIAEDNTQLCACGPKFAGC